jgi:hypothetical protein
MRKVGRSGAKLLTNVHSPLITECDLCPLFCTLYISMDSSLVTDSGSQVYGQASPVEEAVVIVSYVL